MKDKERKSETSIHDLRAFVAIVEQGSFSKAASSLQISQPTVSLRLQNLEDKLGLRLIDRKNGISLTAMGRPLYNQARRLIQELEMFETTAQELGDLQKGNLRVGFSTPQLSINLLGAYRRANPGIELSLKQSQTWALLEDLKRSEIDVAILTLPELPTDTFHSVLLFRQKLSCLVPIDHELAQIESVSWARILKEPLLVRNKPSMTYSQLETEMMQKKFDMNPFLSLPSREAVREAVACGLGVGIIFESEVGADRRTKTVHIDDAAEGSGVYVTTLEDIKGLPAISAFLELAESHKQH
nr:LysR family transcriptional regulator [uncultured Cohaesibacter sp.]